MDTIAQNELKKMLVFSYERVERDKEQVNKINVFPVPDQDTGSNLAATLKGVKTNIEDKDFNSIAELSECALDGALTAAQGNTGIIYTGFLAGFFPYIANEESINVEKLGQAFEKGFERAKDSIQNPKEGTMLDVIQAFAIGVKESNTNDIVKAFHVGLEKANQALLDTPNKMEVLKKAGVVDAGGLGFLMILETFLDTLREQEDPFVIKSLSKEEIGRPKRFVQILSNRYEVVALLQDGEYSEKDVKSRINHLGNCLDVIKVGDRTKIHIHTDDPYEVRDIIKQMGSIENLRIEDMAKEVTGEESVEKVSIGIVVDERAGLNAKIIEHYQIEVIPLRISWPEGETIIGENICQRIKGAKKEGITSRPKIEPINPEFFFESYKKQLDRFEDVICIVSSSKLSNNYEAAIKGRLKLDSRQRERVYVIDSKSINAGQSMLVLEALELIKEQRRAKEIANKLELIVPKINLYCVVQKSDWWNKDKKKVFWFSKTKEETRYVLGEMKHGRLMKMETLKTNDFADFLFQKIEKDAKKEILAGKKIRAIISHGDNLEQANKLKANLKTLKRVEISFINITDPVTSINACPESLLIGWILR
jgi:hypothetical protein